MSPQQPQPDKNKWQSLIKWSGLGIEFAGVILIFTYFGYKLDEKFNTLPWFLLGGFFIGFIGMFYLIIKDIKKMWRD